MSKATSLLALASVLALSACATNKECSANASYRNAPSVEPIQGVGSIVIPESPSALKIPPVIGNEVPVAKTGEVNRRTSCLEFPPELATGATK